MNGPLPVAVAAAPEADFAEIAAALGVTWQAVQKRSIKERWPYREQAQRGGKKRLFAVAALPAAVREAVQRQRLSRLVAVPPAPALTNPPVPVSAAGALPAVPHRDPRGDVCQSAGSSAAAGLFIPQADADKTDEQRHREGARKSVLAALERLRVAAGCSQEGAMQALLALAASGQADPIVVRSLQLARDKRGRKGAHDNGLPSVRSLKRWLAAGDLTPRIVQRDMSVPPWAKVFLERYQQPQKPSVEAAYREACNVWTAAERPSIHQVRRFLMKLGAIAREAGRMGPRELKTIQPFVRRDFSHLEPNDIWSADGHTFDAEVQHPFHGRPFRPEITTIVDIATRRIVGWSVALAESGTAVLDALRYAAEFAGLAAIFYTDRGSGYANALLKAEGTGLAGRLGFEIKHSLPYNSQARGVIERLHKTVWVEGAKRLPSYVGAAMDREARLAQFKLTRRALKRGGSLPLIPWEVFVEFCKALAAEYNARPHRSLGRVSPDLKWREFEARGWQAHRLAAADLDTLFRPRVARTIVRGEIQLFNNLYACPRLEEFHGETVQVAYDIHRPEKVWVYTPEGKFMGEAICDGNRKHYFPVAVVRQAREKRAAARARRAKARLVEIREELNGPALEAPGEGVVAIAGTVVKVEQALAAGQALAEAPPIQKAARPAGRSARPIAEVVDEWLALDARIQAGEAVDEDERYWHQSAQKSPAWRAEMKRRAEAAGAEGRRAAG